jgi:hypothetical protein
MFNRVSGFIITTTILHTSYLTMADESVPLPYPNLQVPTWHYQITSLPELKDQASSSFWKAVEEDGQSCLFLRLMHKY